MDLTPGEWKFVTLSHWATSTETIYRFSNDVEDKVLSIDNLDNKISGLHRLVFGDNMNGLMRDISIYEIPFSQTLFPL